MKKSLNAPENGTKVALAELHKVADRFAKKNRAGTKEVYTFEGNVFVKTLATQQVEQLTYTSAVERSVMFLNNGNVAYRVGDKFFEHDLSANRVLELASLLMEADPRKAESNKSYLAEQQTKLINYIAVKQNNKALTDAQQDKLKAQMPPLLRVNFILVKVSVW